ncbi:36101_t:CDS:2, partial [Racocetra persica]
EEFDTINNGAGKRKEASCRYCIQKWSRGRAYEMKSHLAIKCKGKVPKEVRIKLFVDTYYDVVEAIDKSKEKRANQSLIKWIVSSGISFAAFDNPYFEDYTKALNPSYEPPKHTALATLILNAKVANIIIKIDKELSKAKNLTLCIDNFSKIAYIAKFIAEKIIEVLERIGPEKFIAIVSDAESSMMAAKRQIAQKY